MKGLILVINMYILCCVKYKKKGMEVFFCESDLIFYLNYNKN